MQVYYSNPKLLDTQKMLLNTLSDSYCIEIDAPLQMSVEFPLLDASEQHRLLKNELFRRTFNFANSLSLFKEVIFCFFITN